jgi:hypothetical protein
MEELCSNFWLEQGIFLVSENLDRLRPQSFYYSKVTVGKTAGGKADGAGGGSVTSI